MAKRKRPNQVDREIKQMNDNYAAALERGEEWAVEYKRLLDVHQRLVQITHGCRDNMREAHVVGVEILLLREKSKSFIYIGRPGQDVYESFQLIDILALARKAAI